MWGSISVLISLVFSMWCAFFVQVAISTFRALIFLVFNYSIRTMATVLPCLFMYKPRCQFLCPNLLSFQYVYLGQSNKASFSCFFCAHGNVTSGALISLVFNTSIGIILMLLLCFFFCLNDMWVLVPWYFYFSVCLFVYSCHSDHAFLFFKNCAIRLFVS